MANTYRYLSKSKDWHQVPRFERFYRDFAIACKKLNAQAIFAGRIDSLREALTFVYKHLDDTTIEKDTNMYRFSNFQR